MSRVNFQQPPVAEVVLSVQFNPLAGLSSYRSAAIYQHWIREYPRVSQQPQLPPLPSLDGEEGIFLQIGPPPGVRLWFESADGVFLIQLQEDRLAVNWRRTDNGEYPRYGPIRQRLASAWDALTEEVSGSPLTVTQVEVAYVNQVNESPESVLQGWDNPAVRQGTGRFNAVFEQYLDLDGTVRALRQTSLAGRYGERPDTTLTLTIRAEGLDTASPFPAVDACRSHIVTRFKEITDPAMHEKWGVWA